MARTTQHAIAFDSLEGKVLLSREIADPAVAVYQYNALRFHLTGALYGLPSGISGPDGYIMSSVSLSGRVASMGNDRPFPICLSLTRRSRNQIG